MKDWLPIGVILVVCLVALFFFGSLGRAIWLAIPVVSISPLWIVLSFICGLVLGKRLKAAQAWEALMNVVSD